MSYTNTLKENLQLQKIAQVFHKGKKSESIKDLQHILYELGFAKELKWEKYGADGSYGNCTAKALQAFGEKNNQPNDGQNISSDLAQKLIRRHDLLHDIAQLKDAIQTGKLKEIYGNEATKKENIKGLLALLKELDAAQEKPQEASRIPLAPQEELVAALQAFVQKEDLLPLPEGQEINETVATRLLEKLATYYGADCASFLTYSIEHANFKSFKQGVYTLGSQSLLTFLNQQQDKLISKEFSPSALKVLIAVAENEGNLDAINTWDNSFLSFGIFQWTLGAKDQDGELPALLKKIKEKDAAVFERYFGRYGLDISTDTDNTYGYLTYKQMKIKDSHLKEPFRTPKWAFRFWKAGQHPIIKAIEAQHAIDRLHTFYWQQKAHGFPLSQLITSEYGVALILDNHVNRPGYVRKCIQVAMTETGLLDPEFWTTQEEKQVLQAYLAIRNTFGGSPMTDAAKRASTTRKYLDNQSISDERGSFLLTPRSRSVKIGTAPSFVDLDAYSPIRDYEELEEAAIVKQ